ncbi:MAG: prepilin-type N-terminal cleavage/methylation domain-containing protein [Bdellovibrionota bacterium]
MNRNHRGFTLLEVLIAMIILASGIVLLASAWSSSTGRMKKTQYNTEMAALLERKVAEIDFKYQGKPVESIPDEEEDDFEGAPDYSWEMTSKVFEMPDISAALTGRDGGASQLMIMLMKQFSEYLGKAIKEVTVTVSYNKAKKPLKASVTLFFVDFNKEPPLGALSGMGGGGP